MKRYEVSFLVWVSLALLFACGQAAPKVTRVEAEKPYPGTAILVYGKDFAATPSGISVEVGNHEAEVTRADADSFETILPRGLQAGSHQMIVRNRNSGKSSEPIAIHILERVVFPEGTELNVKSLETISTRSNRPGDRFRFVLANALVIQGRLFAPEGSEVIGSVIHVEEPGNVKGRAEISFSLVELKPTEEAQSYPIVTDAFYSRAGGTKKKDALTIALTTGAGALIGGLAGGKKGTLVGATTGAATGTGIVLLTPGNHLAIPAEASFRFKLREPLEVDISEPLPVAGI